MSLRSHAFTVAVACVECLTFWICQRASLWCHLFCSSVPCVSSQCSLIKFGMPAFPTQAETIEEVKAGRKVGWTERRGLGEVGLKESAAIACTIAVHQIPASTGGEGGCPESPLAAPPPPRLRALLLFSCWILSDSLQPHGLRHARLPCPSLSPRICSDSCPVESVMLSKHLILFCPILLLPSIFPSIRIFSSESALHIRWPKYWSFSFSPFSEYSELISFMVDWLAVQGTLKNLLLHHSSKASILWLSAFFTVQLSHPCTTTGKTIALTRWGLLSAKWCLCFLMCYLGLS